MAAMPQQVMQAMSESSVPVRWRITRILLRIMVRRAVRRGLESRELSDARGQSTRWLDPEISSFLAALDREVELLRADAGLEKLPGFGNRLMVELAVFTAGSDRVLRRRNISPASARRAISDIGWVIYRRMLALISLPVRLVTRDPGRRLRWTIRIR